MSKRLSVNVQLHRGAAVRGEPVPKPSGRDRHLQMVEAHAAIILEVLRVRRDMTLRTCWRDGPSWLPLSGRLLALPDRSDALTQSHDRDMGRKVRSPNVWRAVLGQHLGRLATDVEPRSADRFGEPVVLPRFTRGSR